MRHKPLLATILGLCCLLLLAAAGGVPLRALAQEPGDVCVCTDLGFSWPTNQACPPSGVPCSGLGMITDTLACQNSIFPDDCPLTGSITLDLGPGGSCAQSACVTETHLSCPAPPRCPNNVGPTPLASGGSYQPTVPICCVDPAGMWPGCTYRIEVIIYTGSNCTGSVHCVYRHDFNCLT